MRAKHIRSKALSQLGKAATDNGGHIKIENEPYMPLCVEWIGRVPIAGFMLPALSLCHYGEQNGDLMRDPDVCFARCYVKGAETFIPYSFRNDYTGTLQEHINDCTINRTGQADLARFVSDWLENIRLQGFLLEIDPQEQAAREEFEKEEHLPSIVWLWNEGPVNDDGLPKPGTEMSLATANLHLRRLAQLHPKGGGYYKVGYTAKFKDGPEYTGRLDVHNINERQETYDGRLCFFSAMRTWIRFIGGVGKPEHWTDSQYQSYIAENPMSEDERKSWFYWLGIKEEAAA